MFNIISFRILSINMSLLKNCLFNEKLYCRLTIVMMESSSMDTFTGIKINNIFYNPNILSSTVLIMKIKHTNKASLYLTL